MLPKLSKSFFLDLICYLFVLLFVYASVSKLLDFENFRVQIAQSPLLSVYAGYVAPGVIFVELVLSGMLLFKKSRLIGLYFSVGLMMAFTVYIYLILNYSEFVPCSCGGVLEKLGWTEHLIFNLVFVGIGIYAIWIMEENRIARKVIVASKLFIVVIFSFTTVLILFFSSEYLMKKENPFVRRFIPHAIKSVNTYDLGYNSYYFAGFEKGKIYLGNYTTPLLMTVIDTAFEQELSYKIQLDETNHPFRSIQVKVQAPYFYVYDGSVSVIYRGKLGTDRAHTLSLNDAYFTQMEVSDSLHFVFNTKSSETKSRVLAYLKLEEKPTLQLNYKIMESQIDGIFDTDGRLIGEVGGENFVYVYYYKNEIPIFDKELKLKGKFQTIDTISRSQVKVKKLSSGITKIETPPFKVNDKSVLHRGILFNQSSLMGKFESKELWEVSTIIDVYDIEKKTYLGSFFIQDRGKSKMSQMFVTDSHLYVLSGNEMIQYEFAQSILNYFKNGNAENH